MSNEQREKIKELKKEISQYKSRLVDIEKQIREVSQLEANKLGKIIGRLEDFQVR